MDDESNKPRGVSVRVSGGGRTSVRAYAPATQDPNTRLRELDHAIGLLEARVQASGSTDAHREVNAALQAIHALKEGGLKRRGWSETQSKIWQGILGARSVAYHKGETVIRLWSWEGEDRLRWQIDDTDKIRSPDQRQAFIDYVQDKPVLAQLREMRELVAQTLGPRP